MLFVVIYIIHYTLCKVWMHSTHNTQYYITQCCVGVHCILRCLNSNTSFLYLYHHLCRQVAYPKNVPFTRQTFLLSIFVLNKIIIMLTTITTLHNVLEKFTNETAITTLNNLPGHNCNPSYCNHCSNQQLLHPLHLICNNNTWNTFLRN